MIDPKRLALVPALALGLAGVSVSAAHANTDPLSGDAVNVLAVASCQLDASAPLTVEEMSPVVLGESDVEVVPGEITAHIVRADVTTSLGDVQECTFGVLHRDVQLQQVQHLGTASIDRVDTLAGTSYDVTTDIELGNMGRNSPVDPTTEVGLGGFLTPLANASEDPTFTISVDRKAIETVSIAVSRSQQHAAARVLKRQAKAAAILLKKQTKAVHGKHADQALAKAQRAYDKRMAKAQAQFTRATTPKTVSRPVSHNYTVTGSVTPAA